MDTPVHDRLDQGPQVLVLHSPLALQEPAAVTAENHGLVLQVTLTTLVAYGAVQWMVDLHSTAAGQNVEMLLGGGGWVPRGRSGKSGSSELCCGHSSHDMRTTTLLMVSCSPTNGVLHPY